MKNSANYPHIAAKCLDQPLYLEPAYARVFFSAIGDRLGASRIVDGVTGEALNALTDREAVSFELAGEPSRQARKPYRVEQRIAILPVEGTLVNKFGYLQPYSGMTGYDGIVRRVSMAVADADVDGILLDIDSPGGQVSGVYDAADLLLRFGKEKPIWALASDMACSAAQLLASACARRLTTQTAYMGSVGVIVAHRSFQKALEMAGVDITLIYSGSHKVDGNPYEKLSESVRATLQATLDENRTTFARFVSDHTRMSFEAVMATEAQVYEGQKAVDVGFADQLVNYADAVNVMASAINKTKGVISMNQTTGAPATAAQSQDVPEVLIPVAQPDAAALRAEGAAAERTRIMGILTCDEAKGREAQSLALANVGAMSIEDARGVMAASPLSATSRSETALDMLMREQSPEAISAGVIAGKDTELSGLAAAVKGVATHMMVE